MFYKLIDEQSIEKFKNPLKVDGKHIFTNDEKLLNDNGYYKIVMTPQPEITKENTYYVSKYIIQDNFIYRIWEEKEFDMFLFDDTQQLREEIIYGN